MGGVGRGIEVTTAAILLEVSYRAGERCGGDIGRWAEGLRWVEVCNASALDAVSR